MYTSKMSNIAVRIDPTQTPDATTKDKRLHDGEPSGLTPTPVRGPKTEEDIMIDKLLNTLTNYKVLDRLRDAINKPKQVEITKRD